MGGKRILATSHHCYRIGQNLKNLTGNKTAGGIGNHCLVHGVEMVHLQFIIRDFIESINNWILWQLTTPSFLKWQSRSKMAGSVKTSALARVTIKYASSRRIFLEICWCSIKNDIQMLARVISKFANSRRIFLEICRCSLKNDMQIIAGGFIQS